MLRHLERLVYLVVFCGLGMLSLWLQYGLVEEEPVAFDGRERHDPDYYIENFTAVGMGEDGTRHYIVEAERLVHYPDDDTALLDNPHIVQFQEGAAPRHTYSESGWVSSDGNEVLLTGNVKVIQGTRGENSGGIMTTEKLRIFLDRNKLKDKSGG
jgi:lipopolysaccharide export system protein LptC